MKAKISACGFAIAYTLIVPLGLGVAAHWATISAAAASPALAAWVQGIGSLLAVGAAIIVGQYQAAAAREVSAEEGRRERARELLAAAGLLRLAIRYGEESVDLMDHASSLMRDFVSPEGFDGIRAGIDVLPVHTLPDADAALGIVNLRAGIARFHSRHKTLQGGRRNGMPMYRQQQLLDRMAGDRNEVENTIENLRAALAQVDEN